MQEMLRGVVLIPGSGRSLGEGNDNPLQYLPGEAHGQRSPRAPVHRVTQSWKQLKRLTMHAIITTATTIITVVIIINNGSGEV